MTATQPADDFAMSELTVVEFETSPHGGVYLSELSEGPPFTVHGVALGEGDVTVGQSGIKKKWPAEELEEAADSLKGTNLVKDHRDDSSAVIGRVTKAGYKSGTGVVYQAELYDEDLAEKVRNGLLEVSIRGRHADVDSLEQDEETGAKIVEDIEFENLSIVPTGAAPSNTLEMGTHAELSAAELSAFTDTLDEAEDSNAVEAENKERSQSALGTIEPGMWVKSNGTKGITISQVQDGDIEVDVYERIDGKWRSIGETKMLDIDSIDEWDVDEENIGPAKEEDEDSDGDEEENAAAIPMPEDVQLLYPTEEKAKEVGERLGIPGFHSHMLDGEEWYMPGDDHNIFIEKMKSLSSEEMVEELEPSDGSFVRWKGVNNEAQFGQIISINQDGQQMVADIRRFTKNGDPLDEIVEKPVQGLEPWDESPPSSRSMDEPDDSDDGSSGVQPPSWEDGQLVKWQVNPEMKGKIVHVDREKKILMVEVMEDTEQGLQPTGFTLTAGFQDVIPMDGEMNAVTTRDIPTQDSNPGHETDSMNNLLNRFIEEQGSADPTLSEFIDWLNSENLAVRRTEGEEEVIDSKQKLKNSREGQPSRFIDAEDESSELAKSFDDYPEAAKENARMALRAREDTDNPNDCGTRVGWERANQLASGEPLSLDTVKRMSQFNRHRQNSDMGDEGRSDCGWMMWKAWGGDEGIDWAKRTVESVEEMAIADVPKEMLFTTLEEARNKAEEIGLDGAHEIDGMWVPGETHEVFLDSDIEMSKHKDKMDDDVDDDKEAEAGKHHHRRVSEQIPDFLDVEGNSEDTFVSAFVEWADSADARRAVDEFIKADPQHSLQSGVGALEEWLDTKILVEDDESMSDGEEASADEGDTSSDVEQLQNYEMHQVEFSGTTERDWSSPDMEDFDTDDLSEIDDHFIISSSGFPPENFGDIKLPVVEPNGDLNVNALAAVKGGRGVSAVEGLDADMEDEIVEMVNQLANDEFDRNWGEEEASEGSDEMSGQPTASKNVGGVRVLSGDDPWQRHKSEESDADSLITYSVTNMTEDIKEKLSELDEPVAVEASEIEELRDKADRFEEMSENLEALRERTDILDDVDRSKVEELAEAEDAVVVESGRYEGLQSEAEQVKGVYAAQLSEKYPAFTAEELTDKFSIDELREKYEDQFGSVEDLASSEEADPRSQDADEEELEEAAEESDGSEEELSDEIAKRQEELKKDILEGM